jgi:hypothetical protein
LPGSAGLEVMRCRTARCYVFTRPVRENSLGTAYSAVQYSTVLRTQVGNNDDASLGGVTWTTWSGCCKWNSSFASLVLATSPPCLLRPRHTSP